MSSITTGSVKSSTEDHLRFAERVGRYYEHDGLPYPLGNVLGWLIVCDPPEQSATDIAAALGIERTHVSRIADQMVPAHLLARTELADGEYALRLEDGAQPHVVTHTFASWPGFRDVMRRGLQTVPDDPPGRLERLARMERLYSHLCERLPGVVDRIDLGDGSGIELAEVPPIEGREDDGWNAHGCLTEGERVFVDDFATYYELNDAMPRGRGRMIGWLIIAPVRQRLDDLPELIGATDEDIEFVIDLFAPSGVIVTEEDAGRTVVWMDDGAWPARMQHVFENIPRFYEVLAEGQVLLADASPERRRRVDGMVGLFGSLARDVPALLADAPPRAAPPHGPARRPEDAMPLAAPAGRPRGGRTGCDDVWVHRAGVGGIAPALADVSVLADDEIARARAMLAPVDIYRRAAAWTFVRTVLSQHGRPAPAEWSFVRTGRGRPALDPRLGEDLAFSLSHCGDAVLVAVTHGQDVGVDLEDARRGVDLDALARRCLTASEWRIGREGSAAERRRAFFDAWSAKEAYAKARGLGLAIPFDQVEIGPKGTVRDASAYADGLAWHCRRLAVGPHHSASVCVRTGRRPIRVGVA